MDTKVNFAAVGAFVIVLGAALVAAVLWLAAGGAVRQHFSIYQALSKESVAGLNVNAPVKYRGVDVGKVSRIRLVPGDPQQVQLVFEIREGTPIKTDTFATLTTQGLTGIAYIELGGGSTSAPSLEASEPGEAPLIPTHPSLSARLEEVLTHVLASVETTTHNLDVVFSDANQKSLTTALANIATVTQTLSERRGSIDNALKNADRTMANAAHVSGELDATLTRVDRAVDSFDAMTRQLGQTAAGANQTVTSVGSDVQRFTNESLPQLESLMNELSVLSASLRRLTEETERNPKSLIFGKSPATKGPGE